MGKLIEKIKRVWDYLVELLAFEIMPDDSEFDDSLEIKKIKSDFWEPISIDEDRSFLNFYGPYGFFLDDYRASRSNDDISYSTFDDISYSTSYESYSSFSDDY